MNLESIYEENKEINVKFKRNDALELLRMIIEYYNTADKEEWDNFNFVLFLVDITRALYRAIDLTDDEKKSIGEYTCKNIGGE